MDHNVDPRNSKRDAPEGRKKSHWLVNRKVWLAVVRTAIIIWRLARLLMRLSGDF